MKTLITILYVVAGILLVLALLALVEVLSARAAVEGFLAGYRIAFGSMLDLFTEQIVGTVRQLFFVLFVLLFGGSGLAFAMARLLKRAQSQQRRIAELESQIKQISSVEP